MYSYVEENFNRKMCIHPGKDSERYGTQQTKIQS